MFLQQKSTSPLASVFCFGMWLEHESPPSEPTLKIHLFLGIALFNTAISTGQWRIILKYKVKVKPSRYKPWRRLGGEKV
jgi:hypothetical protein